MGRLLIQKLHPDAKEPTVVHPGEDLGYDLFAVEDVFLEPNVPVAVPTGIAAVYEEDNGLVYGLEIGDRSGLAAKFGLHSLAGKIDAGYRGEIKVVMILLGPPVRPSDEWIARALKNGRGADEIVNLDSESLKSMGRWGITVGYQISKGDKIAQMLPRQVLTGGMIRVVDKLPEGARGDKGFGSSGK